MGTRSDFAEALEAVLGDSVRVVGHADSVAPEPTSPVVVTAIRSVKPGFVSGHRTCTFELVCAVANTTPGAADDELEDLLGDVLDALDGMGFTNWTEATRGTYLDDAFPAYVVTIDLEGKKQ